MTLNNMFSFDFETITFEQLNKFIGRINHLILENRPSMRIVNLEMLAEVNRQIDDGLDFAEWPIALRDAFFNCSVGFGRDDLNKFRFACHRGEEPITSTLIWHANVLVNLLIPLRHEAEANLMAAINYWFSVKLNANFGKFNMFQDGFFEAVANQFESYDLNTDSIDVQIKFQAIKYLASRYKSGDLEVINAEKVRLWHSQVVQDNIKLRSQLSKAASTLGISAPTTQDAYIESPSEPVAVNSPNQPDNTNSIDSLSEPSSSKFFTSPEKISQEELVPRVREAISQLVQHPSVSNQTGRQLQVLIDDTGMLKDLQPINYAFRAIWKDYWSTGDNSGFPLLNEIVTLAENSQVLKKYQKNIPSLEYFFMLQVPELIKHASPQEVLSEAFTYFKGSYRLFRLNTFVAGLIQVVTGVRKEMIANNDQAGADELFDRCNQELQYMYHNKKRTWWQPGYDWEAHESWKAWNAASSRNSVAAAQAHPRIFTAAFIEILEEGDYAKAKSFIESHFEELITSLQAQITLRPDRDKLFVPEGDVYQADGARKGQLSPSFSIGKAQLIERNYSEALRLFQNAMQETAGLGETILLHYIAYAQAQAGKINPAYESFENLNRRKVKSSSVYWNFVCVLPSDQSKMIFEILMNGLENAPAYYLLENAINQMLNARFNGFNPSVVRKLLEWSTFTEAQCLAILFMPESEDFLIKQKQLFRIAAYISQGRPTLPSVRSDFISEDSRRQLIEDVLVKRRHPQAVEFWLSCLKVVSGTRPHYCATETDFLYEQGALVAAANSFVREAESRRRNLAYLIPNNIPINQSDLSDFETRSKKWWAILADNNLVDITAKLKSILLEIKKNPKLSNMDLFPEGADTSVQPFATAPEAKSAKDLDDGSSLFFTPQIANIQEAPEHNFNHELSRILAFLGPRLQRGHSELVNCLPALRDLESLLDTDKTPLLHQKFTSLLENWSLDEVGMKKSDREMALSAARGLVVDFKTHSREELDELDFFNIDLLIEAFNRFNNRWAVTLSLLPTIQLMPLYGESLEVDTSAEMPSFCVRIASRANDAPVRLAKVVAFAPKEDIHFVCRNNFNEFPYILEPAHGHVLTFEVSEEIQSSDPLEVSFTITYESQGTPYTIPPITLNLSRFNCPEFPPVSPFVYGRPLIGDEIQTLFAGRKAEQRTIFEAIQNGQQHLVLIEGMRRVGKSSLLHRVKFLIESVRLPIITIITTPPQASSALMVIRKILEIVVSHPEVKGSGFSVDDILDADSPDEMYAHFQKTLAERLPDKRVLILLDDFQLMFERIASSRLSSVEETLAFTALFNKIRDLALPDSRLLWVFSGQYSENQYKMLLPGVLMWALIEKVPVSFLPQPSITEILTNPLKGRGVNVPVETAQRLYFLTGGHPESAQELAHHMYKAFLESKRAVIAPSDADEAAYKVATTQDHFEGTWFPTRDLSQLQMEIVRALIETTSPGESLEISKLVPTNSRRQNIDEAIEGLVRKNVMRYQDGKSSIRFRAPLLEIWVRERIETLMVTWRNIASNVGIFADMANLTLGGGEPILYGLDTSAGQDVEGGHSLKKILDLVERYALLISNFPVSARYAIDFPENSPASAIFRRNLYQVEVIPENIRMKGSDDLMLMDKINEVKSSTRSINTYIILTADKDYIFTVTGLLEDGNIVHLLPRKLNLEQGTTPANYNGLAAKYPERFKLVTIEDLINMDEAGLLPEIPVN